MNAVDYSFEVENAEYFSYEDTEPRSSSLVHSETLGCYLSSESNSIRSKQKQKSIEKRARESVRNRERKRNRQRERLRKKEKDRES